MIHISSINKTTNSEWISINYYEMVYRIWDGCVLFTSYGWDECIVYVMWCCVLVMALFAILWMREWKWNCRWLEFRHTFHIHSSSDERYLCDSVLFCKLQQQTRHTFICLVVRCCYALANVLSIYLIVFGWGIH